MRLLLLLFFLLPFLGSRAQYFAKEKKLADKVENATSDEAKIAALGQLAEFYYIYRAEKKGDSILQKQFLLAELSHNKRLLLNALFGNAITNIGTWTSIENFDKALAFLQKGLSYASETDQKNYEALAYIRIAGIFRRRAMYDKALQNAMLAYPLLYGAPYDSLKTLLHLETGDIFLEKGDAVLAFKNYNLAYDLAYNMKNGPLQSEAYHHYANLYRTLGNDDMARKSLLKSLQLNQATGDRKGLLLDYIDLARLTDEKEYFDKATRLADSLQLERYQLYSKQLLWAYLMVVQKDSRAALQYLNTHEDLNQSYLNTGLANYYWNLGNVYRYSGRPDSAIIYYNRAEPEMNKSFDITIRRSIHNGMGECYLALNEPLKARRHFEQALELGKAIGDYQTNASITQKLSSLYAQAADFKTAYAYNLQHLAYKDTLQKLANQRNVALLEVERENRRHEKDLQDLAAQQLRTHNLQYIGISLFVATFFIILILIGMFPVSRLVIRLVGFFAFICFFELITVMIDSYLHHATDGEPLKIWLAKIFIIALLLPLHHFLEHLAVRFLESQKLVRLRQRMSVTKAWHRIRKPAPATTIKEDTAVL